MNNRKTTTPYEDHIRNYDNILKITMGLKNSIQFDQSLNLEQKCTIRNICADILKIDSFQKDFLQVKNKQRFPDQSFLYEINYKHFGFNIYVYFNIDNILKSISLFQTLNFEKDKLKSLIGDDIYTLPVFYEMKYETPKNEYPILILSEPDYKIIDGNHRVHSFFNNTDEQFINTLIIDESIANYSKFFNHEIYRLFYKLHVRLNDFSNK